MRWVASEDCTVKGPARAVLWVIAYHADRDTGECWVGQRRLARESGLARATVQRALDKLFADGVLEPIEDHQGPKPERYMVAPHLVEGESFGSGVVEGTSTPSKVVEHEAIAGEVIHNPGASGLTPGPQVVADAELVDSLRGASGLPPDPEAPLVDSRSESSGLLVTRSPAETAPKVLSKGFELQGSNHVVDDADSTAHAVGVVDAPEPPPSLLRELERRGLRPRPRAPAKPEQQPRSREEQLAILERIAAEDEAKSSQEGKP